MIQADQVQCKLLAQRLDQVQVRPDEFLVIAHDDDAKRREANLWFFLVAICQSTRTLQGVMDGRWYRGWDYMVHAARRALRHDPEHFTASRLAGVTADDLRALFSDDGQPEHSTFDRIEERVSQWRQIARQIIDLYGGNVMNLYQAARHQLRGEGGILQRLAAFEPYSDPVEKKSFLFIMFAHRCGAWQIEDLEHLQVAIDYHIMRVALRSGIVRVLDAELERTLKARQPVTAEQDNLVRQAVRHACALLVQHSQRNVFEVDNILWMMGRNCCFYDYDPICGANLCQRREQCTFTQGIEYACPGACLFDGVCLGSRDTAYQAFWETTLYTHYY